MYKVAGVSKFKGEFKVRFANDMTRVKLLQKSGNTDIELVELPKAMNKPAVVAYLKTTDLYKVPAQAAAIDAADTKYNGEKTVKVKKAKPAAKAKAKPTMAAIKAKVKKGGITKTQPAVEKETSQNVTAESNTEAVTETAKVEA
jgi:protein tyrosine phosphatase (PTP) superfamily phosphohydrolase (DUF442 family)